VHKSIRPQVSKEEIEAVWDKLTDERDADGEIIKYNKVECQHVRTMLAVLGVDIAATPDCRQDDKQGDATHAKTIVVDDEALLKRYQHETDLDDLVDLSLTDLLGDDEEDTTERHNAKNMLIRKQDFVAVEFTALGGSASLGIAIFFIQTFALIMTESALFGSLSIVNFDTDAAIKQCTAPFTFTERFSRARSHCRFAPPLIHFTPDFTNIFGASSTSEATVRPHPRFYISVVGKPAFLSLALLLAVPIWNFLRAALPQSLWARFRAPPKIKHVHCHRALVNIFLSLFAPLTRASMEILICKSTCEDCTDVYDDGAVLTDAARASCEVCRVVNVVDTSVECWTADHVPAAAVAAVNLAIYAVLRGFGRIVALHYRAPTSYQMHEQTRRLYF
jgi:hypothetical protein